MDFDPDHPYGINIFDGPAEHTAKYLERIIWPQHRHVKFTSLDYPMPDYGYRCKRKLERADPTSKMSDYWRNVNWDEVQAKCETITDWVFDPGVELVLPYQGRKREDWRKQLVGLKHRWRRLIIGDSHAHSAYVSQSLVLRKDGRTLNGLLKKGLEKEITDYGFDYDQLDELVVYFGNIDVRHHLCRAVDPIAATKDLVKRYEAELKLHDMSIEVVTPLPIEDESRKLPSTGYYLGTPFFGARAERMAVVNVMREELKAMTDRNGWKLFSWPDAWYKLDGMEVMELMEKPRSVHLARRYYRWDLERGVPNPILTAPSKTSLLCFD